MPAARAGEVRVAVAANFTEAAKEIGDAFAIDTGHRVRFSFASTGQIYAQITQGAPFDVFLAADRARPRKAVAEGYAVKGSRFTYAQGRLVLYSRDGDRVRGARTLKSGDFERLAVANPATAPYGAAAIQVLKALGVHDRLEDRLVRGNNVAQAYQFVASGNAEVGFVALSQVIRHDRGSRWMVPQALYDPIAQDAVLLKSAEGNEAAQAFLSFLNSRGAHAIMDRFGYGPGGADPDA